MSKGSFGLGVILGSTIGVASAYLLAQKSGEALQEDIKDKANDSKNKMVIKLDEMLDEAEITLSEKLTDTDSYNPPVQYEVTPETVAAPPENTALVDDPIVVPDVKL
ncbi:YtxH domain-containing protein [Marinilactibacillus sp. XAAS-LB27]|uniref:YtxH domain-containing protein n=1 Tax=Marinilactibacillus sp. XAAS-LB27 TaxID=3114538 RepID=UPI002E17C32C|nr:YtxH domain-containing protein [Marinilactibacillus sp. XAAS-LB27]